MDKMVIHENMRIQEILAAYPYAAQVFIQNHIMFPTDGQYAEETIGETCRLHGIDPDKVVRELNDFVHRGSSKSA